MEDMHGTANTGHIEIQELRSEEEDGEEAACYRVALGKRARLLRRFRVRCVCRNGHCLLLQPERMIAAPGLEKGQKPREASERPRLFIMGET